MLSKISLVYLACAIFVFAESAIVDNLNKCTLADQACHRTLYTTVITEAAKGFPEIGIKPMDPYSIMEPLDVAIDGVIDLKVESAVLEGLSKCTLDKSVIKMDEKVVEYLYNCPEVKVVGGYNLGKSPFINKLLGQDVTGNGKAVVTMPNVVLQGNFAFKIVERDGKIYFSQKPEESTSELEVKGDVKFNIDNVRMGDEDVSALANGIVNRSSKNVVPILIQSFGKTITDFYFTEVRKFFNAVPANNFISDDLSAFVDK